MRKSFMKRLFFISMLLGQNVIGMEQRSISLTDQILNYFDRPNLREKRAVEQRFMPGVGYKRLVGEDYASFPLISRGYITSAGEPLGFVRAFNGNTVVQLRGISQQTNMECGFLSFANAQILLNSLQYPEIQKRLLNKQYIDAGKNMLAQRILDQRLKSGASQEEAKREIQEIRNVRGLYPEDFFGGKAEKDGIVIGNEGKRGGWTYELFPPILAGYDMQTHFSFANPNVQFSLPRVCIVNIGSFGGHYIAVRFERLRDGGIGIVFVDSIQFREGEFIDKIDAYKEYFKQWFNRIPDYLAKEGAVPQPTFSVTKKPVEVSKRPVTVPPISAVVKEALNELLNAIIQEFPQSQVNDQIELLKLLDAKFKQMPSLQLTQKPEENSKRRIDLIRKIVSVYPATKEVVLEFLFNQLGTQEHRLVEMAIESVV